MTTAPQTSMLSRPEMIPGMAACPSGPGIPTALRPLKRAQQAVRAAKITTNRNHLAARRHLLSH